MKFDQNPDKIQDMNIGMWQLYFWMKCILSLHQLINPLNFVSSQFVQSIFSPEETKTIENLFQCYENWRGIYSIKLKSIKNKESSL